MTTTALHRDFEGLYRAHFRTTVTLVYAFTTNTAEAQDIAQEAFAGECGLLLDAPAPRA